MKSELRITAAPVQDWHDWAHSFADLTYRHTWAYGSACAARVGAASEHIVVHDRAGKLLGLADVRVRRMPLVGGGIAYVNGGPLVRRDDAGDRDRLAQVVAALRQRYVHERGLVLRIALPCGPAGWLAEAAAVLESAGFDGVQRGENYRTFMIDLTAPAAGLRAGLARNWRNHLSQSERKPLAIESGTDAELFDTFCGLYVQLLERKRFAVDLDAEFHARLQQQLALDERFVITVARLDGRAVAGHVASSLGDTSVYLLGASTPEGLQSKATYRLQWEVMTRAKDRGFRWYDLGGVDPLTNPGVYSFKAGMGGQAVTVPGPFECRPRAWRAPVALGGERVFRAIRATFQR